MPTIHTRLLQFLQQYTKYCNHQFLPLLTRTGITMREVHVLLFLANNPDYDTARDITVLRGISKSQVSQAVDLLTAEGFLLRTPDQTDRRIVHLAISPDGWPLAKECLQIQESCSQQLMEGLTPEEEETFRVIFEVILNNGARLAEDLV